MLSILSRVATIQVSEETADALWAWRWNHKDEKGFIYTPGEAVGALIAQGSRELTIEQVAQWLCAPEQRDRFMGDTGTCQSYLTLLDAVDAILRRLKWLEGGRQ